VVAGNRTTQPKQGRQAMPIEQHILDTYTGKQPYQAATDV